MKSWKSAWACLLKESYLDVAECRGCVFRRSDERDPQVGAPHENLPRHKEKEGWTLEAFISV